MPATPPGITEFEKQLQKLRLTHDECASSDKLRQWCDENKDRCYIPEWLLKIWRISSDSTI